MPALDTCSLATSMADLVGRELPIFVVATKPSWTTKAWRHGSDRRAGDDNWLIGPPRPKTARDRNFVLQFDSPLDYGGVNLAQPDFRSDKLTKKLMCREGLEAATRLDDSEALRVFNLSRNTDWFLRWRLTRRLHRNSDVRKRDFQDFCRKISHGPAVSLVPTAARLDRLAAEIGNQTRRLKTFVAQGQHRIDWTDLAQVLGVNYLALSLDPAFRRELASRLEVLCPEHASEIRAHLDRKRGRSRASPTSSNTVVHAMLEPWSCLADLSARGMIPYDPLSFKPFEGKTRSSFAIGLSRKKERTTTILPSDLFRLLNEAARWVVSYADHIIFALEMLQGSTAAERSASPQAFRDRLAENRPGGLPEFFFGWSCQSGGEDVLSVADVAKCLVAACSVIIGTFGARRLGELESLRVGCAVELAPGVWGMTIYIEKTLRDVDVVPIPAIAKLAISVLERLTRISRERSGESWLLKIVRSLPRAPLQFIDLRLNLALKLFTRVARLAPPQGRADWDLASHQLRRGFAIIYYHGFRFASVDDLSQHLRHWDPAMTEVYIRDVLAGQMGLLRERIDAATRLALSEMSEGDRARLEADKKLLADLADRSATFNEVRCEAYAHRMLQTWDGSERPTGRGAERFLGHMGHLVDQASQHVLVLGRSNDPDAIRTPLTRLVRDFANTHYLEPVPGVPAHCTAGRDARENHDTAECLKRKRSLSTESAAGAVGETEDERPDFSYASSYVCLSCIHAVCFSEDRGSIKKKLSDLERDLALDQSPARTSQAQEKYERYKRVARNAVSIGDGP